MRRTDKHYNAYAVFQKIKESVFIPPEHKGLELSWSCRRAVVKEDEERSEREEAMLQSR